MRLDKFLKVSRIIKRRTVANDACDGNKIWVNGKPAKASCAVKIGDIITVAIGERKTSAKVLRILESPKKEEADSMYQIIEE